MCKSYFFVVLTIVILSIACSNDDNETPPGSSGTGGLKGGSGGTPSTQAVTGETGGTRGSGTTVSGGTGGIVTTTGTGGVTTGTGGVTTGTGGVTTGTGGVPEQPDASIRDRVDAASDNNDTDQSLLEDARTETPSSGILPPVDSVEADGPFQAINDSSGPHYVWRPVEMGQNGLKHPIFVWGTGAGATPDRYDDYFIQFATHGIVVVAPTPASLTATNMGDALNWILEQNETQNSPYYQKLDPERIGMGGHSQGSLATFDLEGTENRIKTTIHIAGGSFDGLGSSKVKTPTAYICGETDIARPQCEVDFENMTNQPTFFSILQGVDHVTCARRAMPGMIAWLRWHLGGETWRSEMFTGPDGEFFQGIWQSQTKNWTW